AHLVRERLLEHRGQRVEGRLRLLDGAQLDLAVAREDEVEQLQAVQPLLVALQAQPSRRAKKLLVLAEPGHCQIGVRRLELGIDLLVDRVLDGRIHGVESSLMVEAANRYRIRQPLTGPPWKNGPGVITPSRLNTRPSFITNCTRFSASISSSGLPGTAMRSARKPALIGPRVVSVSLTL